MRNKTLLSLMLAAGSSALYAGTMGPVSTTVVTPTYTPFVSGEASYSWPKIDGVHVNFANLADLSSQTQLQGWGGRLAAGVMRPISESFALSFEGGLMYNDHVNLEPRFMVSGAQVIPPSNVVSANFDQYGFDMLAGLMYTRPSYDLFFKAGALFENMRAHISVNANEILRNNRRQANFVPQASQSLNVNVAQVMPEIKLGGAYHVTENWSLTAAWMYAFGGKFGLGADNVNFATGSVSIGSIAANLNNPSINAVLFGAQYKFN